VHQIDGLFRPAVCSVRSPINSLHAKHRTMSVPYNPVAADQVVVPGHILRRDLRSPMWRQNSI